MQRRNLPGTPLTGKARAASRSGTLRATARGRRLITRPTVRRLAAALLLLCSSIVFAQGDPSVMLFGARLDDARSFAVETAAGRGWHIRAVSQSSAVFEQVLDGDEDEDEGLLVARRILRIQARLAEDSDGTRISLHAEEVELPGTEQETRTDVTALYIDNLSNALGSLRNKWDDRRSAPGLSPPRQPTMGTLVPERSSATPTPLGDWAYAAERYAMSRGCVLTERATELTSSGQDWEEHRVYCEDGSQRLVQCRHGDCTASD
jgi:hypothetical protein